jgi:proteasome lid subunit RPN8/RPN11
MSSEKDTVKVLVSDEDWGKIMAYLRAASPNEIIGLAHAEIKDGAIRVFDPLILKQEVGPATCEIDMKAMVEFLGTHEPIEKVKCVWHSHVNMGAHFSQCDRAALGKMIQDSNSWWVSVVINLKQEYECVVDMYKPFRATLPCDLLVSSNPAISKEVSELVKQRTYQNTAYTAPEAGARDYFEKATGSVVVRGGKGRKSEKSEHDKKTYTEDDIFREIDFGGRVDSLIGGGD